MPVIALTACIVFIFCAHARHASRHHAVAAEWSCAELKTAYADFQSSWKGVSNKRDTFVRAYPVARQHRVLECIGD